VHRRLLALVLVVLGSFTLLSACSSKDQPPHTTAPAGFTVYGDGKNGFAIAYPSDWRRIPLTDDLDKFNVTANSMRLENPKLADAVVIARSVSQNGGTFFAVDSEGTSMANLTVYKAQEKTVEATAEAAKAGLTERGATDITTDQVTVAGLPAARVRYNLPVTTDQGTVTVAQTQYYVLKDKKAYILTVLGDDPAGADTIAETLRIS
jgi:hypothetical protein